jgi:hypothetical protein
MISCSLVIVDTICFNVNGITSTNLERESKPADNKAANVKILMFLCNKKLPDTMTVISNNFFYQE